MLTNSESQFVCLAFVTESVGSDFQMHTKLSFIAWLGAILTL